ncbi:uncharacterized protein C2845_PM01G00170 [Panicum miliaceum]|uniref:tRNA (guanosine(18)-2'-O)-methyltransferase TARBP1 n=1 Tax=Panicum miliaceum TaxID=4540 RepID=A0A3L6TJ83_PANMI|nr:uncharacterized protein C2845_PM01G00170 [Panicum miliaceum]
MASPPKRAVAALESCFRALPADAVPAVVDCVLASSASTSPTQLFHALLRSPTCPEVDNPPKAKDALRLLLWRVFLPLLRDTIEPNLHQVVVLMCDAISDTGSWDLLGATIVPFCIRSSAVAMGLSARHDSMLYHSMMEADFAGDNLPPMLTLSKASSVLAPLLGDILVRRRTILSVDCLDSQEGAIDLDALVQNLTWDLSTLVLKMFAHGQEYRSCATRTLLQPLLISLADNPCVTVMLGAVQHKLSRFGFLECIWDSCISLFSLGCGERLDAYNILSLYFSTLKSGHQVAVLGADKLQEFDLRNVREFWNQLRKGLVDKDSFVRKHAFYVLTISLSIFTSSGNDGSQHCSSKSSAALPAQTKSNTATTKRERWANKEAKSLGVREMDESDERCSNGLDRWKIFLLLYEMLQEYGTHLVEVAWTHQVMLLFESTPQTDYLNHTSHGTFHAQMESWEGILQWMTVLWERGFTHDNPQVRCLVMQSFLDIAWERYKVCTQMIPRGFVLGSLIRGLNDVVHHKDFGIGGVYNSKTIKGAENFFSTYAQNLTRRDRMHLVWSLASAAKHDSFGRAGLMTLASCVASCTCQSDINDVPCATPGKEASKCDGDVPAEVWSADLLDALWILSERSKQHFNPKYRLKVCEQVIKVAASLINATEVPVNQLLHFISTIPRELTDYFGPLRVIVQEWFVQKKECSPGSTLLSKLIDFPTTFMKHNKQDQGSNLFDDEDVNAWEAEARRWARSLFLVTSDEQHLKRILGFIEAHGFKLSESEQCPVGECVPVKFFIIVLSFIEELEVGQRKLVCQDKTILKGGSDRADGLELHDLNEKLAESLSLVLETMVVFSKLSCSVFWLRNIENMDLPYSVKGKLGGPSQRRLATSITSSVLQGFIENLLNEGSKSPRTIRLAALHLSGLWLMYPKTLRFYMEELKLLSLYGSVAFDEDFEAELSENHEARFEVSMLAQSPDREFTEVFINTELYARVSVAVLFHQLWKQIEEDNISETEEALQSGKLFLLKLLDSAVNDKDLSKELYKKYSSVHRRKVRVWQMICVLSHYVEDDIVREVISSTHTCLYRNNLPAVRQYLETFAILLYLKFPTMAEEQLIPIFHDKGMRQQALSSYVFIAANIILHSRQLSVQINHLNQLLPPILPFLTSHHHSLRGFTQLLVHSVLSRLWPTLHLETSEDLIFERRCFQELKDYLAENSDCVRLRVSIEGFLDVFDPNASGTPSGIFSARSEVSEFECVPVSVMERVIDFLNDVREDWRHAIAKDTVTIKNEGLTVEEHGNEDNSGESVSELSQPGCQDALDFQKKITPRRDSEQALSLKARGPSRLISEIEEDDQLFNLALEARLHAVETIKQSQQELIVVASLVDRIPNLAGLTRTCEVFRAAGLVVADKSILQDKQFRLISVTAEKWLPISEVPVDSVKAYLERKRSQGYSVIGLEQTAHSRPLDQFSFPRRTVLVLGREKEGIPVDIIHVLDGCVEIPQLGVVRSLNVHVSGAIAAWEYTRQHNQPCT